MKKSKFNLLVFLLTLVLSQIATAGDQWPVLKGSWLGQKPPPGLKTESFAPGLLSTDIYSPLGLTIPPKGNEIFYTLFLKPGTGVIMVTKVEKGRWCQPGRVPFTGEFSDWDINLSPDGNRLYFSSFRPVPGRTTVRRRARIWYVERKGSGSWSKPYLPDIPGDDHWNEVHPTVASNGNIYFFTLVKGRRSDIFCSELINGRYQKPYNLGSTVNTPYNESDPFVAPDESYVIFQSKRPGGFGKNDLYISFRDSNKSWRKPVNMGARVNTKESDKGGRVTFDGRYFFFSRSKPGSKISDFYWVRADFIHKLKPGRKSNSNIRG